MTAMVYFMFSLALVPAPIAAEYWVREMIVIKRSIAKQYAGQEKIIIASGSGALFGIDSVQAGRILKMPVINFGLHAGLPLKTILSEAENASEAGDMVILPLESHYYCDEEITDWQIRNAIAWGHEQWHDMPLVDRLRAISIMGPAFPVELALAKLLETLSPRIIGERLMAMDDARILAKYSRSPEPMSFAYSAYHVDALGNMRKTEGSKYMGMPRAADDDIEICAKSWGRLGLFVDAMKHKGVKVYFANPPYVETENLDAGKIRAAADRFNRRLSRLAPVLDSKEHLVFPRSYFLNTELHLNAAGRAVRTQMLVDSLLQVIRR